MNSLTQAAKAHLLCGGQTFRRAFLRLFPAFCGRLCGGIVGLSFAFRNAFLSSSSFLQAFLRL